MLENKGIATFISAKRSYRLGSFLTGAFHVVLWVVLDAQLGEAAEVLRNPDYSVRNPLTSSELARVKTDIQSGDMTRVLNVLVGALVIVLFLALVMRALGTF